MNTLLIDSGGTKAGWVYLENNERKAEGTVAGIHPFFLTKEELAEKLHLIREVLPSNPIQEVFHYGTGTNSEANCLRLLEAYEIVFPNAKATIDSDLLAVAHALCGRKAGIAVILGTGSNVGLYDGRQLVKTVGGLGYVLGDEGSGVHLGKTLLNYYLNDLLPIELENKLEAQFQLSRESVLEAIYRKGFPNRYLASMAPFIAENLSHPFIIDIVRSCFRDFFKINILPLLKDESLPLCFGGSIAFHFEENLRAIAKEFEVEVGKVSMGPMEGLVAYHSDSAITSDQHLR